MIKKIKSLIKKSNPAPAINKNWKIFVTNFKPSYAIHIHMYQVIPGIPVHKKTDVHSFEKGEYELAKSFYDKVITKTGEIKLAPIEIQMVRGKKKVIHSQDFGPISDIKLMKISA